MSDFDQVPPDYSQGQSMDPTPLPVVPGADSTAYYGQPGSSDPPVSSPEGGGSSGWVHPAVTGIETLAEVGLHMAGKEVPFLGALAVGAETALGDRGDPLEKIVNAGIPFSGLVTPFMMGYADEGIVPDTGGMTQGEVHNAYRGGAQSIDPAAAAAQRAREEAARQQCGGPNTNADPRVKSFHEKWSDGDGGDWKQMTE